MPSSRTKPASKGRGKTVGIEYRGKQTKTGNSSGFRFEGALFKSHPEFNGEVTAYVLAPGRLLVTADTPSREKNDPTMEAFLAFLSQDISNSPHRVLPLDSDLMERMNRLVDGVEVSSDEDLGPEVLL